MVQFGPEHNFTSMIPNLAGLDPDDAFSSIPYEKGFALLYQLETLMGPDSELIMIGSYSQWANNDRVILTVS